jgi:AraC-like DNA-binding protein
MPERDFSHMRGDDLFPPHFKIFANRCREAFKLPMHTHDFIEMSYVVEGSGYQFVNNRVLPVKKGDLFLLPLGTSHVYRPSSPTKPNTLIVINCLFLPEAIEGKLPFLPETSPLHSCLYHPKALKEPWLHYCDYNAKLLDRFEELLMECRIRENGYEVMMTSLLVQILTLLQRGLPPAEPVRCAYDKLEEILDYMRTRYADNLTVSQAATRFYMSPSHLQRVFKRGTGQSFTHYLQNLRIERSCELLKTTNWTVQQIASQVGYQDMKYFHTLFRKITGVSPREYRNSG